MSDTAIKNIVIIDGNEVEFSDEPNLLEVIRKAGINVPTFCYRPELSTYGACRMCVVEIEGAGIQTSCTIKPTPGMKVRVNTERTRRIRKIALELLLANHNRECTTCSQNGSCDLQTLAYTMGIRDVRFKSREKELPIDNSNPSIIRDPNKCILCGACTRTCKEIEGQGVIDFANRGAKTVVTTAYDKQLKDVDCVYCGQCMSVCPTGALRIKSDIEKTWGLILDDTKTVAAQIAPAVRVAIGEAFGLPPGENSLGLIVAALKKIGFDKVFDTSFTADLTIMEEAAEFLERFKKGERLPLFTSCCPAWVRFAEQRYPEYLNNLSTCKSPQQMFGSLAKKLYKDLTIVSIMPCTAKKAEAARPEFGDDVDIVLTTQEIIRMIKEAGIDFNEIEPQRLDSPFGSFTGAGVIFGASGGVAEAALRTAYEVLTGETLENVNFKEARGLNTLKEFTVNIKGTEVRVAIVNTLKQADEVIKKLQKGEVHYDFIEIMACPGGCIGGAGQPVSYRDEMIKKKRAEGLYKTDVQLPLHKSHENPQIKEVYEKHLEKPNSHVAHELLHTHYKSRKRICSDYIDILSAQNKEVEISVCVGTSCYLKGSYQLIEFASEYVKKHDLEGKVNIKATFCAENCGGGPSVIINGELISACTKENLEQKLNELVTTISKG